MSAARDCIVRRLIRSMRYDAQVMTLVSRDEAFRPEDYAYMPHRAPVATFSQMASHLEQYANDLEERLLRVKP